jgi:hypothetical protein
MKHFLLIIAAFTVLGGCNVINPQEQIPTYIHIDSVQFMPGANESKSAKITSVWLYFNNQSAGVYELPATIPVIMDRDGHVQMNAGVTYGGILDQQVIYPFYNFDSLFTAPQQGKVINWTPKTSYRSTAKFKSIHDFENGTGFVLTNSASTSDTAMMTTNDATLVLEGSRSGYIRLTSSKSQSISIEDNEGFSIPQGESYIEINYKSSVDLAVGLQTTVSGDIVFDFVSFIKPKESWNKLYISTKDFVDQYRGTKYRIMIKATLPDSQTDGYALIDNIKLVSF